MGSVRNARGFPSSAECGRNKDSWWLCFKMIGSPVFRVLCAPGTRSMKVGESLGVSECRNAETNGERRGNVFMSQDQ